MRSDVRAFVHDLIGPFTIIADHTRRGGRVVAIRDTRGRERVVKTARRPGTYRAEVRAYRRWTPVLQQAAPMLLGADPDSRAVVLERLPGRMGLTQDPSVHREAGRLLAALHAAEPARLTPEHTLSRFGERMIRRRVGRQWSRVDVELIRRVERSLGRLPEYDHLAAVPTHGDYGPQNWLRSPGRFGVIDFEHSGWGPPVVDFARLYAGQWWGRPDLPSAFFRGYGRTPTGDEIAAIGHLMPLFALGRLARGLRQHRPRLVESGSARLAALYAAQEEGRRCPGS